MKKTLTLASIFLSLALCFVVAVAAGGDAGDPLISLSFLEGLFKQETESTVDFILDSADEEILKKTQEMLEKMTDEAMAAAGENLAAQAQQTTLNQHDALSGSSGLYVTAHAGMISVNIAFGAVIDVTSGREIPSGSYLSANHSYIVAENSSADFIAVSPTAVLSYQGHYTHTPDKNSIDYYGIALALRELGLFRGSGSGIGEGFDLHLNPTRAQALVMFIRILGEEQAALTCTYEHPFTDVPTWLDRYAAWAWHKGYTNGVGNNKFGTDMNVTAVEYQEFLLRALGYSVAGVDDYTTSLERALECGALTDAEYFLLSDNEFLRAYVAYLSYYSLDTLVAGTYMTLAQQLQQQGAFSFQQLIQAKEFVSSHRLH